MSSAKWRFQCANPSIVPVVYLSQYHSFYNEGNGSLCFAREWLKPASGFSCEGFYHASFDITFQCVMLHWSQSHQCEGIKNNIRAQTAKPPWGSILGLMKTRKTKINRFLLWGQLEHHKAGPRNDFGALFISTHYFHIQGKQVYLCLCRIILCPTSGGVSGFMVSSLNKFSWSCKFADVVSMSLDLK